MLPDEHIIQKEKDKACGVHLATNYFDSVQMLHPPCPSLRHLNLTDGTLWVVFYPRFTLKLGWEVVAKTHHDSMGGVNSSQEWTRIKRNLSWGVAEHMTSRAKGEQRGHRRSIICLNKNNTNSLSKTQSVWNLNYPRHATVVSIKKKKNCSKQTITGFNCKGLWRKCNLQKMCIRSEIKLQFLHLLVLCFSVLSRMLPRSQFYYL